MGSRMEKYEFENMQEMPTRTSRNKDLYQSEDIDDYNKIDINSNVSVLNNDIKSVDVDKIREILDKKYQDNVPRRRSIDLDIEPEKDDSFKEETKEYDINDIIAKAKGEQSVDYHEERLRNLRDTNYQILEELNLEKNSDVQLEEEDIELTKEKELKDLINTITQLELENTKKAIKDSEDLLNLTDATQVIVGPSLDNSFYTGNLEVKDNDFDDFKDIQDEIKSNSILIKLLVAVFIIIVLVVLVIFLNSHFEWGLF